MIFKELDATSLDDRFVRFGYFSGIGDYLGADLTDDSALVEQCGSAFEAAWAVYLGI